ncbi:MAG TPA: tetratricopeptide repeat protein [Chthoniobacterales bacterium]|nr:tetratricopeptide repeat protein [Chthoniobacterales bacterium]
MNPKAFFTELRRRNVYRVAVAYAVVAWLIIQIAAATFPVLEIPRWCVRLVVVLLAFGFPVAVILAWAYELTPEGIRRTEDVAPQESIKKQTGQKLNGLIIGVLACTVAFLLYQRLHPAETAGGAPEKSIAVLPFENFSDDKENAFFADGIQDDILTSLAKIHELKVISRTSVMPYRGATKKNLPQIAQALGVVNVLEGSVRRGENRVVVTVQLIDARNDRHLWAKRYDRPLADSLGLQGELASEIASELRATLSPEEKGRVETKPTKNPDAYVLYLKARTYESNPDRLFEAYKVAEELYTDAIQHDPSFALAYARLAATEARIYRWFYPTDDRKARMKTAAEKALELSPDLGEGHLAFGLYYYWAEANYEKALEEFRIAAAALPNDSDIGYFRAAILRRQGQFKENLELLKTTQAVDPGNVHVALEIAFTYAILHDWPQAARAYDRVVTLAPESANYKINRAYIDFYSTGKTAPLKAVLAQISPGIDPAGLVTRARWDLAMIERDFAAAEMAMSSCPLDVFESNGLPTPKSFYRGCVALARGDLAATQTQFAAALPDFEKAVQEAPGNGVRHANLGLLYSFMGRKEEAIREGRRAVELLPESKDAVDGPWVNGFLAMIYARTGDADSALPLLERLLATPGQVDNTNCCITASDLRSRWQWDPIRNDPRFQKLLAKP